MATRGRGGLLINEGAIKLEIAAFPVSGNSSSPLRTAGLQAEINFQVNRKLIKPLGMQPPARLKRAEGHFDGVVDGAIRRKEKKFCAHRVHHFQKSRAVRVVDPAVVENQNRPVLFQEKTGVSHGVHYLDDY